MVSEKNASRLAYIDFLRGIAALFVVYQHTSEVAIQSMTTTHPMELSVIQFFIQSLGIGEIGVVLFFLISGFVVPFSLTQNTQAPVRTFLIHRFFRLYPAYWLSVLLGILFVWWRFGEGVKTIHWNVVFMNISMLQAFFGIDNILGSYWTLSLELFFYAICLILFVTGKLTSVKRIFFAFFLLVIVREIARHVPTETPLTWNVFFHLRYMGFMFSGLFFRLYIVEKNKSMLSYAGLMFALTFLLLTGKGALAIFHGDMAAWKTPLNYLIALSLFLLAFWLKPSHKVGNFLGKISYSIYLFHPIIFYPIYFYIWLAQPLSIRNHPHLFILVSMVLTILFSILTFYCVEKPSLALGRRLSRQ